MPVTDLDYWGGYQILLSQDEMEHLSDALAVALALAVGTEHTRLVQDIRSSIDEALARARQKKEG